MALFLVNIIWYFAVLYSIVHILPRFVVSKVSGNEVRETDSPTPPLLVHNHVMNNVDYNKEDIKDKNSVNEENHVAVKSEGSVAR